MRYDFFLQTKICDGQKNIHLTSPIPTYLCKLPFTTHVSLVFTNKVDIRKDSFGGGKREKKARKLENVHTVANMDAAFPKSPLCLV